MQQYYELSFGQVFSIEIDKIRDNKNMFGTKTLILVQINFVSLMSFSLKFEQNQGFEYFINVIFEIIVVLSIFTRPPDLLFIPICILMLILYLFFYGCFLLMTYLQYQSQNKITMSKYKFKRLHILMSLGIECAVWLGCSILFINLWLFNKQSSAWSAQVHRNYSYYLKYQCFRSLFFDSNYKQAKIHGSFSKAAHKQKQIGNFQWLSGDLVTLEVSEGVQSGQIIKGVQIDQLICQDMQIMII